MKPELFPDFRVVPLFAELTGEHLGQLTATAFVQQFPAEVVLQPQDAVPDFLYAVITGSVEVTAQHLDAVDTIEVLPPGSVFTLSAVIRNEPALATARTVSRSRIIMIPAQLIRNLLAADIGFANVALQQVAQNTRGLVRKLHNQKMRTSTQRLANWVVTRHDQIGEAQFEIPYQKRVLASLLGMTPENLSRTFAGLEAHGVRVSGRNIEVTDTAALEQLASPTPLIDGVS